MKQRHVSAIYLGSTAILSPSVSSASSLSIRILTIDTFVRRLFTDHVIQLLLSGFLCKLRRGEQAGNLVGSLSLVQTLEQHCSIVKEGPKGNRSTQNSINGSTNRLLTDWCS